MFGGPVPSSCCFCTLAQGPPSIFGRVDPVHSPCTLSYGSTLNSTPGPHSSFPCRCLPLYLVTSDNTYTFNNILKKIEKVSKKKQLLTCVPAENKHGAMWRHLMLLQFTCKVQCT